MIRWLPSLNAIEALPPVPIGPSRSEVQVRPSVSVASSSSVSLADPLKLMVVPESKVALSAGLSMVTVGARFGVPTVILTEAVPVLPPESITDAVMT